MNDLIKSLSSIEIYLIDEDLAALGAVCKDIAYNTPQFWINVTKKRMNIKNKIGRRRLASPRALYFNLLKMLIQM